MTDTNYPWLQHYPEKPDWHMPVEPGLITDALKKTFEKKPHDQALDFLGKTYSWSDIYQAVNQFAAGLQKRNIGSGHKVGLFLPNCPLSLIAYYGILKTGATVVNYNPLYAEAELVHQIEDSETDVIVSLDLQMLYEKNGQDAGLHKAGNTYSWQIFLTCFRFQKVFYSLWSRERTSRE